MTAFTRTNIRILILIVLMSFQSCQYFNTKNSKEKLLQKELQSINWKQVDEFPMIDDCEKLHDDAQQKQCFFEMLSADLKKRIKDSYNGSLVLKDTVFIKVTVQANSKVLFKTQNSVKNINVDNQKIDSILQKDTIDFPRIKPALKRGIVVKSEFVLPIVF